MALTIQDVQVFLTQPGTQHLIVVKIVTSEPGLYGLGCATFTQRHTAVKTAIEDFLAPLLKGRDPQRIEDIWNTAHVNSYWRNGPVLNNALSGVDMALWDIKGKIAGLPVYQLFGGKCREAAAVYRHAGGNEPKAVEDSVRAYMEMGFHYIRCQMGGYGGHLDGRNRRPEAAMAGAYYDPDEYARGVPKMFAHLRETIGYEVELLHDIHERLVPIEAVRLAKNLEPFRLFFLEDALPPEQIEWFRTIRAQCATPLAMGELFVHSVEWLPLIENRLIDFIRCHISAIGGLTPAKKLATLCEAFGVRTAWHGPGDVSPIGHAANLHLDLHARNFGIQEWAGFSELEHEMFPGCPQLKNGYAYLNEAPGLGLEFNEKLAARYPCDDKIIEWTQTRLPDGTPFTP